MERTVGFDLPYQWKLARNRPSDAEPGHRRQRQRGHPPVRGQQLPPFHPQLQCCGRHGAGLYVWGLPCFWGLTLVSPPSATTAAVTRRLAVLSSRPEKTHLDFWSSPARQAPWAAGERSRRKTSTVQHCCLLQSFHLRAGR